MATVVPAQPRFSAHRAVYAVDPLDGAVARLGAADGWSAPDDAALISVLVLGHSGCPTDAALGGMVWVWAQVSPPQTRPPPAMPGLVLAMPPGRAQRASAAQLIGGGADDPTADIARRLSARFRRPIFVSLNNVSRSRLAAAGGLMAAVAAQTDEAAALERCLAAELARVLPPLPR
ncbi:hypothetical protein H4R18_003312 [Coemansia javaensis]|uniref:Uncharacterized protein n=1 Tax=Coemansia javaensis TaxID=2761396 RepID=A0A9W8LIK9_9FUNG|nr:hypothetical protein H4R18_003312 [Coemansia javaensis]